MGKRVRAVFDGEALRPEKPVDLRPDTTYIVTVEREVGPEDVSPAQTYVLSEIGRLATDMGVTDLASRHDHYAHRRPADEPNGG